MQHTYCAWRGRGRRVLGAAQGAVTLGGYYHPIASVVGLVAEYVGLIRDLPPETMQWDKGSYHQLQERLLRRGHGQARGGQRDAWAGDGHGGGVHDGQTERSHGSGSDCDGDCWPL
jgi:hypothetical protein